MVERLPRLLALALRALLLQAVVLLGLELLLWGLQLPLWVLQLLLLRLQLLLLQLLQMLLVLQLLQLRILQLLLLQLLQLLLVLQLPQLRTLQKVVLLALQLLPLRALQLLLPLQQLLLLLLLLQSVLLLQSLLLLQLLSLPLLQLRLLPLHLLQLHLLQLHLLHLHLLHLHLLPPTLHLRLLLLLGGRVQRRAPTQRVEQPLVPLLARRPREVLPEEREGRRAERPAVHRRGGHVPAEERLVRLARARRGPGQRHRAHQLRELLLGLRRRPRPRRRLLAPRRRAALREQRPRGADERADVVVLAVPRLRRGRPLVARLDEPVHADHHLLLAEVAPALLRGAAARTLLRAARRGRAVLGAARAARPVVVLPVRAVAPAAAVAAAPRHVSGAKAARADRELVPRGRLARVAPSRGRRCRRRRGLEGCGPPRGAGACSTGGQGRRAGGGSAGGRAGRRAEERKEGEEGKRGKTGKRGRGGARRRSGAADPLPPRRPRSREAEEPRSGDRTHKSYTKYERYREDRAAPPAATGPGRNFEKEKTPRRVFKSYSIISHPNVTIRTVREAFPSSRPLLGFAPTSPTLAPLPRAPPAGRRSARIAPQETCRSRKEPPSPSRR